VALKTVTLTWDLTDLIQAGQQGTITLEPSVTLTDPTDQLVVAMVPRSAVFAAGVGQLAGIIACDNAQILPNGWGYVVTVAIDNQVIEGFPFTTFINFANGATQDLSTLTPVQSVATMQGYMPLPSGTPTNRTVPYGTGSGEASAWTPIPLITVSPTAPSSPQSGDIWIEVV
jgi:hypothetical protein